MNSQDQMLANQLEDNLKRSGKSPQEFLKSIPNSVNLKENPENPGVYQVEVLFSPINIKRVSTNGTQVLVKSLT